MVYTRSKSFYPLEILKTRHFKMPTIWQKDNIILNRFSLEIAWKSINLYIKVTAQHIICSYSIKVIAANQLQEKHCGTPVKSNTPSCVSFSHFHPSASAAVCSLRIKTSEQFGFQLSEHRSNIYSIHIPSCIVFKLHSSPANNYQQALVNKEW